MTAIVMNAAAARMVFMTILFRFRRIAKPALVMPSGSGVSSWAILHRGGLGHVGVLLSMSFAGISGSSTAEAAGVGGVLIPAMKKQGYDTPFTVALIATAAVMGVIIPPSILMVVWGGVISVSIGGIKIKQAVRDTAILFIPMLLVLLIVILFPQVILWLPRLLMPQFVK